jgi:hypothetical protein
MRHDTSRKVDVDEDVAADRMFPQPASYEGILVRTTMNYTVVVELLRIMKILQ